LAKSEWSLEEQGWVRVEQEWSSEDRGWVRVEREWSSEDRGWVRVERESSSEAAVSVSEAGQSAGPSSRRRTRRACRTPAD
jgi:hypothetical protein